MPLKGGESRKMDRSKLPPPLPEHELAADEDKAMEVEDAGPSTATGERGRELHSSLFSLLLLPCACIVDLAKTCIV